METPRLIYFADPMCSWCYGFSPVIQQIRETFGRALPIQVVMGGLRPGTDTPTTDAAKAELKTHWGHVHEATACPSTAPCSTARASSTTPIRPPAPWSGCGGTTARRR